MVKIRHFLTFMPVRSSEIDNDNYHLVCVAGHRQGHPGKRVNISLKNLPRAAES